MPTIPPASPGPLGLDPRQARQMAESFGVDAARYNRARPRYPGALADRILAACPGRDVLDAGCGTGIVARQFQAAGCRVLGIDPDARMADFARATGVDVEVARIEEWEPAGREFDAVVAGQAWHWVDPVAGAAKAAQVLRPGGRLAVFWNASAPPPGLWAAFAEVYQRVLPDSPLRLPARPSLDAYSPLTERAGDGMRAAGLGQPEVWQFDWARDYSRDEWLDQLPTAGPLTQAPPEVLAAVLAGVGTAIDQAGGSFPVQFRTIAVTAVRG